jgi:hypothetical protein
MAPRRPRSSRAFCVRHRRTSRAPSSRTAGLLYEPNGAAARRQACKRGAINALLDYRYSHVELLTWYFDHHVSAFQEEGRRGPFPRRRLGAEVSRRRLRVVHAAPHRRGPRALRVDRPRPRRARLVVRRDRRRALPRRRRGELLRPARDAAIAAVIQEQGDEHLNVAAHPAPRVAPAGRGGGAPGVSRASGPIKQRHDGASKRMADKSGEQRARRGLVRPQPTRPSRPWRSSSGTSSSLRRSTAWCCSRNPKRVKISVGFNPWAKKPRRKHNIAATLRALRRRRAPRGGRHLAPARRPRPRGEVSRRRRPQFAASSSSLSSVESHSVSSRRRFS